MLNLRRRDLFICAHFNIYMYQKPFSLKAILSSILMVTLSFMTLVLAPEQASAAALANISDTLSSQTTNAAANHTLVFRTPTGAADTSDTITITFPSDFTMNSIDFADVDLAFSAGSQSNCNAPTYSNDETLAGTPGADTWGAALAGRVLTLTAPSSGFGTTIAANACVQVQIGLNAAGGNTQISNPSSADSYVVAIGGLFGDVGSTTVNILNDDEVDISAVVDQSLTFSISDTSIGFGTLNTSASRYATGNAVGSASEVEAHNIIVGTNASGGYTMTASGTTLTCAACGGATIDAIGDTNTASTSGTEQFGLRIDETGGSGVVSAPYGATGFAFDTAAFPDVIATAGAATSNTTYSARYLANIAADTDAGSYNAAITYVATANF
jgi:hypothetical protein